MTDQPEGPVFTEQDRLLLLQLMTRRAMSERREVASAAADDADEGLPQAGSEAAEETVPAQWRLVPDGAQLYAWQRECLPIWLGHDRGTVKVATGGGKTLFALAAAQALQNEKEPDLRLVIVVPTIPLMFQWHDEVRRGNVPSSAIALMGGGQTLPLLSTVRILVCVLNSARERLPALVRQAGWSSRLLLVVDECHRSAAAQARRIFETKPAYALGLSATPESDLDAVEGPSDEAYEAGVVGQALGPIIFDFTLKQSLEAGLLTPFEVWHVGLSLSPSEAEEHAGLSREISDLRKSLQIRHGRSRSKQGFLAWCQTQASKGGPTAAEAERFIGLANRRKRLLYRASARSDLTLGILSEAMVDKDSRAIVFHESIQEIEALFLKALGRGIPAVLEHSKLPDSLRADNIEAFREGVGRVIVSAKSLVEGFNVPSADLGIIAASSASARQRIQSLGRMLRRKAGGRTARVFVLYVRDTEDEAIYAKADWENVIGAERNRYFTWRPAEGDGGWEDGLQVVDAPPRKYRPPSWEVEVAALAQGDPYPGQAEGREIKVDQADNVRTEDGSQIPAPRALVEAILQRNRYRRARITPAGHLIVRVDANGGGEADWRYLGVITAEPVPASDSVIRLRMKRSAGRRVIAREGRGRRGRIAFALGPEAGGSEEAGRSRDRLLDWVQHEEKRRGRPVPYLYWDGETNYWLEVEGQRIPLEEPLAPLEFDS